MKQVYILLTKTRTVPSRLIARVNHNASFTHASIALLPETNRLYSFARKSLHNPFYAGLICEDIHTFVFAQYPDCPCSAFKLNVSDEAYDAMKEQLDVFLKNRHRAKYNFLGVIPQRLGIRIRRKYRLTCSQFVSVILSAAPEITLPKDPYLMLPHDLVNIPGIIPIYNGTIKDCSFRSPSAEETSNGQ